MTRYEKGKEILWIFKLANQGYFFDISDNVNSSVFAYDWEKIVDDCGDKYWGVYFWIYNGTEKKFIIKIKC